MSSKRRGIVKESRVELSVREVGREGGREGGNFWFIEVLTHLKNTHEKPLKQSLYILETTFKTVFAAQLTPT